MFLFLVDGSGGKRDSRDGPFHLLSFEKIRLIFRKVHACPWDVHAHSVREKSKSAAGLPPAPRPSSHYRDSEDIAPSIVVHHEHTNIVGPDMSGVAHLSSSRTDSATMTAPDLTSASTTHPNPSRSWAAPRTQFPFDKSPQVLHCSGLVLEESALPLVSEVSRDSVFTSSPPEPPGRASLTMVTAPLTTNPIPSTKDTTPNTDGGPGGLQRQKQATPSSDTSYSQEHRAIILGPSNYSKRHLRRHLLALLGRGPVLSAPTLITILGLVSSCSTMIANSFILSSGYRTARVHNRVTAYDSHTSR